MIAEALREHIYNSITQGCECQLFAAKSPTITKDEWARHAAEVVAALQPAAGGPEL